MYLSAGIQITTFCDNTIGGARPPEIKVLYITATLFLHREPYILCLYQSHVFCQYGLLFFCE
jgi:hypothetical protein